MILSLTGCSDDSLEIDNVKLEGTWVSQFVDERESDDGYLEYTFLSDGICLQKTCNYLDSSIDPTQYGVYRWTLSGNKLTIISDNGNQNIFYLEMKSKDKILLDNPLSSASYPERYIKKLKGKEYKSLYDMWYGLRQVSTIDNDGVETKRIGYYNLEFEKCQRCTLTTSIEGLFATNKVEYFCFWSPETSWFTLVDSNLKEVYRGQEENGFITLQSNSSSEVITLQRLLD